MLESFIGTYDWQGLSSLKCEASDSDAAKQPPRPQAFWAIIDKNELPDIHNAICMGNRNSALAIILERAQCLGCVGT